MSDAAQTRLVTSRVATAGLGAALIGIAVWITWRNGRLGTLGAWIFWVPVTLFLLTMGLLCWWFTLRGHQPASRSGIRSSWRTGWIVGGIGLALGYVGPLVITPKATLGPLLGILLTGPLGFVLGALGAAVFHESHRAG
jgi:hypothetical protein